MPTYAYANFEQIGAAISVDVSHIEKHRKLFDAAARWYRLDKSRPERVAPSKLQEKLSRVEKSARRLLNSLGIRDLDDAFDGTGDPDIFDALALAGELSDEPVTNATRRIGRLIELLESVAAAAELDSRARQASTEIAQLGKLIVREGNRGNEAVNEWIAAMMHLYRRITGKVPATSVGAPDQANEGIAAGPLVRFLAAAGKPLQIEFSEDAWRSRVRSILSDAPGVN